MKNQVDEVLLVRDYRISPPLYILKMTYKSAIESNNLRSVFNSFIEGNLSIAFMDKFQNQFFKKELLNFPPGQQKAILSIKSVHSEMFTIFNSNNMSFKNFGSFFNDNIIKITFYNEQTVLEAYAFVQYQQTISNYKIFLATQCSNFAKMFGMQQVGKNIFEGALELAKVANIIIPIEKPFTSQKLNLIFLSTNCPDGSELIMDPLLRGLYNNNQILSYMSPDIGSKKLFAICKTYNNLNIKNNAIKMLHISTENENFKYAFMLGFWGSKSYTDKKNLINLLEYLKNYGSIISLEYPVETLPNQFIKLQKSNSNDGKFFIEDSCLIGSKDLIWDAYYVISDNNLLVDKYDLKEIGNNADVNGTE